MNLNDHDLKQIDEPYVRSLPAAQQLDLCLRILSDLKNARDRLNQTPENSSMPSGSLPPWASRMDESESDDEVDIEEEEMLKDAVKTSENSEDSDDSDGSGIEDPPNPTSKQEQNKKKKEGESKRKPGKQPGAEGHGREVELDVTGPDESHRAAHCAGCGSDLSQDAPFHATTGLYVLDLIVMVGMLGLKVTHIKHLYGDTECICGHMTRSQPGRCESDPEWNVALTEWHLVGPMLSSLIVCLSVRMRLSRKRIQEFLNDWLGVWLSVGTINQCIHEAGRATEPLEEQMIEEVQSSGLLHADETSWKERREALWFWVFSTATITLFVIGKRSQQVIERILGEAFSGWLMTDGYKVYRKYLKRLRCWAHLERKAKGLAESLDGEARKFGKHVLAVFAILKKAVYQAREGPSGTVDLKQTYEAHLNMLMIFSQEKSDSAHEKTRALAREFLNDWEAIWAVLSNPHLPMTNNEAEQLLRHWVIYRRISYGTRTPQGSRVVALLASVIETCRKRNVLPWPFLADVIAKRRKGEMVPALPAMVPG